MNIKTCITLPNYTPNFRQFTQRGWDAWNRSNVSIVIVKHGCRTSSVLLKNVSDNFCIIMFVGLFLTYDINICRTNSDFIFRSISYLRVGRKYVFPKARLGHKPNFAFERVLAGGPICMLLCLFPTYLLRSASSHGLHDLDQNCTNLAWFLQLIPIGWNQIR